MAETPTGQSVNVNADEACRELSRALVPFKVVFLSPKDGLRDDEGQIVSAVNLAEDYETLIAQPWMDGAMKKKLEEAGAKVALVISILDRGEGAAELYAASGIPFKSLFLAEEFLAAD